MSVRLESLTIKGFRGITDEAHFEFSGENTLIVGPNGSGKSTILQAVEFLITGEISALRGAGTGGITPTQHIPNQYADPVETAVSAIFSTDEDGKFSVSREFSQRNRMVAKSRPESFRRFVAAANQGLLNLTREDILELVIATPGSRKDQIYQLMDTVSIDDRRKQLKRLARTAKQESETQNTRYEEQLAQLEEVAGENVTTEIDGERELEPVALRDSINQLREELGGDPIDTLNESFRGGLDSPYDQAANPLQRSDVQENIERLIDWFDSDAAAVEERVTEFVGELRALHSDADALTALSHQALVERGLALVDSDTTRCPLCEEPWPAGDLETQLEHRAERLSRIDDRDGKIDEIGSAIRTEITTIEELLATTISALDTEDSDVDVGQLESYLDKLNSLRERLDNDVEQMVCDVDFDTLEMMELSDRQCLGILQGAHSKATSLPSRSTIETYWDDLGSLQDAHEALKKATQVHHQYAQAASELERALELFLDARDDVFGELFEEVNASFARFYEAVNPDESAFDPSLGQTDTGVDFAVDFYESGEHPPNALHSEGHQDLMGVCLFLALANELASVEPMPVLLDDVVMSVDETHRERFAAVLADELRSVFQFLITTHEESWAEQLVDAGVVRGEDVIRFVGWTPHSGPSIETGLP